MDLAAAGIAPIDGIRVGIGGWTYAPWRGRFYPQGLPQHRELEYASRQLSCIEINGTYYRAQTLATYAKWRDATPEGFVFAAKAPRRIMQSRQLASTGRQVEDFVGGIAELGAKLGPLVWQFEAGSRLQGDSFEAFCNLLPRAAGGRSLRHVIDMRDPGFADAAFIALMRRHGFATVFTDAREHPSYADITAGFVYARLMRASPHVGTGYRRPALLAWARRAREWAAGGQPADLPRITDVAPRRRRREVFVQFIGAAKERNPAAAMALIRLLG